LLTPTTRSLSIAEQQRERESDLARQRINYYSLHDNDDGDDVDDVGGILSNASIITFSLITSTDPK
jgi:hypothetical protein